MPGPIQSKEDEETILDGVFTQNKNFFFGNPITKVFKRIQSTHFFIFLNFEEFLLAGYFGLPHFADHVQHRDHRRVLYDHYIRHYHTGLLPKLLANRHVSAFIIFMNILHRESSEKKELYSTRQEELKIMFQFSISKYYILMFKVFIASEIKKIFNVIII